MANEKQSTPQRNIGPRGGHGGPGGRFRKVEKPKNMKGTLKRLMNYVSNSKKLFIGLIFIALIYTLCNLSSNVLIEKIVASLGEYSISEGWKTAPSFSSFLLYTITLLIVYILYCIFQYLLSLISAFIAIRTVRKMRNDLFEKMVYLPIKYTDTHAHGDLMSRMTNDVDNVSTAISSSISSLLIGILTIIGCLAIMLYYSPLLTLISLSSLVLTLLLTSILSKFIRPLFSKQQKLLGNLNSQTEEMVSGCKTVIAYNHQQQAQKEFNEYSDRLTSIGIKAQILSGSFGPIMNFIGNVGYFLICFFGCYFVLHGMGGTLLCAPLTISIVIMFLNTSKQFTRPINEMAQQYSSIISAIAGAERVFSVIDEPIEDFNASIPFDGDKIKGQISFNHLRFSYVPGKEVLKDFTLDAYSGHKIALVGATGSGKTTIVNLLMRFYDLDSGSILIDGIDIQDVSKKALREEISIVLQDAVLFHDTIKNNVKYGNENASDEQVLAALKMANCGGFVSRLPEQENTILNEGATNISQGQRQLLTIARAILANPKILILDEATSSVDTRTEKKIQDAMVKLMANRTSIIIAHRLSTIQDADLIVVLDQGCVVEMGNHKELIEKQGVYNTLYQTQFSGLNT